MKKQMIGAAMTALCLASLGSTAVAQNGNPSAASLPKTLNYYASGSHCDFSINAVCYWTGPQFTGNVVAVPWGVDDVELNGRWHFASAEAKDGIAMGLGPTDSFSMAICVRRGDTKAADAPATARFSDLRTDEWGKGEPFSVVGHYKATTPSLSGDSASVDCSKRDVPVSSDGYMHKRDTL